MDVLKWIRNQWDRVSAWVLVSLGALALILGWVGVTGTPYTFEQIPYVISGGLGGLFLLGVGAMLWISADLRDEWRKLDRLLELHEHETLDHTSPVATEDAPAPEHERSAAHAVDPDDTAVISNGVRRQPATASQAPKRRGRAPIKGPTQ